MTRKIRIMIVMTTISVILMIMAEAMLVVDIAHAATGFTLGRARVLVQQHYASLHPHVGICLWSSNKTASCPVRVTAVIVDGLPATTFTWNAIVTRSGPCPLTGTIHNDKNWHNCFTGPLVVM